jgi:thiamine-monophosphate kinase
LWPPWSRAIIGAVKADTHRVSELGEFALIARLQQELGDQHEAVAMQAAGSRLVLGIGDDAAVWVSATPAQIATTDTLVEGVHFPHGVPWSDLGWKSLAINVSDVAALGGTPEYALITLALPGEFPVRDALDFYRGLAEAGRHFGVVVAGGDMVRAPQFIVTVALTGRPSLAGDGTPLLLRRDAARAGDAIAVSGCLGDSAGGLRLLTSSLACPPETAQHLSRAHLRPEPPVELGRAAVAVGLRCAIDVSDGLAQDLGHVCEMSGLGAVVHTDRLPISEHLQRAFPEEATALAAAGGEDYELLLTGPVRALEELGRRVKVPLTIIGEMVAEEPHRPRFLDSRGREIALADAGWDHFAVRGH